MTFRTKMAINTILAFGFGFLIGIPPLTTFVVLAAIDIFFAIEGYAAKQKSDYIAKTLWDK